MATSQIISVVLVGNTEQQVLGPNPRRRRVIFGAPSSSVYQLRNTPLGNVAGGFNVATSSGNLELSYEEHGDIVCRPFIAFSAAGPNFGIVETIE